MSRSVRQELLDGLQNIFPGEVVGAALTDNCPSYIHLLGACRIFQFSILLLKHEFFLSETSTRSELSAMGIGFDSITSPWHSVAILYLRSTVNGIIQDGHYEIVHAYHHDSNEANEARKIKSHFQAKDPMICDTLFNNTYPRN